LCTFLDTNMVIYITILALLMSIVVAINNWSINRGSIFLSALLILISIFGLHQYALTGQGSVFWLAVTHINFASFWYLFGPLLLWYTRSLISDEVRFYKTDFLHLIPFTVYFAGGAPYMFSSFDFKESVAAALLKDLSVATSIKLNVLVPLQVNAIARVILVLTYATYSLIKFIQHIRKSSETNMVWKEHSGNVRRWFISFLGIMILIDINNLIGAVEFVFLDGHAVKMYSNTVTLINSILVAGLPMILIAFPDILYGLPRKTSSVSIQQIEDTSRDKKLLTATDQSYFSELSERVQYYFEAEKPYLNRDFSFDDLVSYLNVPRHHIYFCLNSVIKKKFIAIKNSYRVAYAKDLLMQIDFEKFTIESVALQSGFASRSNFYSIFKEVTGVTPKDFLKQNGRNISLVS
jgi:AraC-like DNA-binding protein